MYKIDSLENAVRELYYSGIAGADYEDAAVEAMLDSIDFYALLQAVRHKAKTVHTYTTQDNAHKHFNYEPLPGPDGKPAAFRRASPRSVLEQLKTQEKHGKTGQKPNKTRRDMDR